MKKLFLFLSWLLPAFLYAQTTIPNVQDGNLWSVVNRTATPVNDDGKKGIHLDEIPGDGLMILKGSNFSDAIVELDIRGSDKFQQSFVGFAFHGNGRTHFDAIYFRPFNFNSDDPQRKAHSVQYINMPDHDWQQLRNESPGKYENSINPPPKATDWFHAKIVIKGKHITVYVNDISKPVLEVDKLNENSQGGYGFWVGNNSGGDFANLNVTIK